MTAPIRGAQCRAELLSKLLRLKSDRGIFTRRHSTSAYLRDGGPRPKMLIRLEGAYPFCVTIFGGFEQCLLNCAQLADTSRF